MYWKKFNVFPIVLFCQILLGQAVLTEAHMPKPNQVFYISQTTTNIDLSYFTPGENLTWDFSSLISMIRDTICFYHPISSQVPLVYATVFFNPLNPAHKATVCKKDDDFSLGPSVQATDVFSFFKLTSNAFIQVGTGATINGIPTAIQWTPTDTIYELPLQFTSTGSSYSFYDVNIPSLGYYSEKRWRQYHVDAHGTTITPMGTFATLRIKTHMQYHDSIYYDQFGFGIPINRSEMIYEWYSTDFSIPLVRITQNMQMNRVEYIDTSNVTGLVSFLTYPMVIYPVPAHDKINILTFIEPPFNIRIIDLSGRIMHAENVVENKQLLRLSITDIDNGIYFLQIIKSNQIYQRQFVIQR